MSAEQRLSDVQDRASRSARLREQFGLGSNAQQDRAREWMTTSGAIPVTVAILLVVGYVVLSVVVGWSGP